jgi:predicted CopG family antitoxin
MFDAVKIFSATKQKERDSLGEVVTEWLDNHAGHIEVVDKIVKQSSDNAFHCITIVLFYRRHAAS